jgi:hypothetical protein
MIFSASGVAPGGVVAVGKGKGGCQRRVYV